MPKKKVNEEENKKNNKKDSLVEKKKIEKKGKRNDKINNNTIKEKKALPKVKEKKTLPKVEEKKALPKIKEKKLFPKSEKQKSFPTNKISEEEKNLKILEKIKSFFFSNPDEISKLDDEFEKNADYLKEYYDLPYRYNETIVRILAQTPKRLFIYWDISDEDIQKYRRAFGDDFFEKTYPILLVHNEEKNYTYEVPINDFANSWYLDINDSKCKYTVKLARKFKEYPEITEEKQKILRNENININVKNNYIEIVNSNTLESPNDHILFEKIKSTVKYRNVKNKSETTKEIKNLLNGFAKVYNIYELYNIIYKSEMEKDMFNLNNPSSAGNPSSSMTSSVFK